VRALLTPPPNRELRIKSQYVHNDKIKAAIGIKICAPGLENAVAGSPVMVLPPGYDQAMLDDVKDEVMADFKTLAGALATDKEGVLACASTLGALEALLVFLREECDPPIPVSAVSIGPIFKKEVMRAALMHEKKKPEYATILAFDVDVDPDAREAAVAGKVTIFTADIIYHLFDQFTTHRLKTLEEEKEKAKDIAVFPCLVKIMPNMVFNQKDPIICGVTVEEGILKVGTPLCIPKNGFIQVGRVTSIENNHQQVEKMGKGSQCAIQIVNEGNPGMTYGRQFNADHALYSELSRESIDALKKYFKDEMSTENWKLVVKLKKVFSII
jgi:translation initiation factor 5B